MLVIKLAVFVYIRKAVAVCRKPNDASRQKRLSVNAFTWLVYAEIMFRKELSFLTSRHRLASFNGNH